MDNKIDIKFINKQIEIENNVDNLSDILYSIDLCSINKIIDTTKKEIANMLNDLNLNSKYDNDTQNNNVLQDINNIQDTIYTDKTSYEYRSKFLKRKLKDTNFYSIIRKNNNLR